MKNFAMKLVWFTTFVVFFHAVIAQTSVYERVFFIFVLVGPVLIMYTVYRVLIDNYHTDKTFEDWYEDVPKDRL